MCPIMYASGGALSVALGLAMTWYAVALCNAATFLVYSFLIVPFLPESPTFLIVTGKEKEALKVLRRLRGKYTDINNEMDLFKEINNEAPGDNGWSFLLEKKVQKTFLKLITLFLVQGFCGTEVIRPNAIKILERSGVTDNTDLFATILLLVPIAGTFVMSCVMDNVGRRECLVVSLTFTMIAYVVLGSATYLQIKSLILLGLNHTSMQSSHQVKLT